MYVLAAVIIIIIAISLCLFFSMEKETGLCWCSFLSVSGDIIRN